MNLSEMTLLKDCEIRSLNHQGSIKRRLLDLGIMEGARIKPVLSGSHDGMRAYLIKGTLIALRKSETDLIDVQSV